MKIFQKMSVLITLITLFAACQSSSDTKEVLSKTETRMEIMNNIANDSTMSKEMMVTMMNSNNGKMMMMENHAMMMQMMKGNTGMMHTMMNNMMEACKNDTAMMSGMCKAMMGSKEMMEMMNKMKGEKADMKMEGMKH